MPIVRTFQCPNCNHRIEQTLTAEQWDSPPPSCEMCDRREMSQEFKPPAIGGSVRVRAGKIAEDIIEKDYGVSNITLDRKGGLNKITYRDQTSSAGTWQASELLQQAVTIGRQNRRDFGPDGLDILKRNLADGTQPDLIEASKRRAIKIS